MIFIRFYQDGTYMGYYNVYSDLSQEILDKEGFFIDKLPEEPILTDKQECKLSANKSTKEVYWVINSREPSQEEILEERLNQLEAENAQLLKDGARKDIQLEMLQTDVADLVKTIAQGGI